jgi:hypothetical protein
MPDQDQEVHKLDVTFEVIEHPRDDNFPHSPNVVSHRGHQLRITAIILDVPEGTQRVKLQADVLVYGPETLSANGYTSSSVKLWGHAPEQAFPVNVDTPFPHPIDILVTKNNNDDHLGEGPYGTFINIAADNIGFEDDAHAAGAAGTADGGEAAPESGSIIIKTGHTFELDFVSE